MRILGVTHDDPFFAQCGSKNGNFQRFQQTFFRTTGFRLKFLILIEFPNRFHWKQATSQSGCDLGAKFGQNQVQCCEKSKEAGIIISFFHFTWRIPFKAKSNGCKTTCVGIYDNYSQKYQILRMAGPIFCLIWVKNGKKLIIFNNFTLVSKS